MPGDATEKNPMPPYVAFKTFSTFIDRLRPMPGRIDRSVMQGMSGATQSQLSAALKYLGLVGPGNVPTQLLCELSSAAGKPERAAVLGAMLKTAYPFLYQTGFDLRVATSAQLNERFRETRATGGTLTRCVAFFLAAAKAADLPLSPHIKPSRAATAAGARRGGNVRSRRAARENGASAPAVGPPPAGSTKSVALRGGGTVSVTVSVSLFDLEGTDRAFVFGLIDSLAEYERSGTRGE